VTEVVTLLAMASDDSVPAHAWLVSQPAIQRLGLALAGGDRVKRRPLRRAETWLWTGPIGHLVGGVLDWGEAMGAWGLRAARRRWGRG